MIAWLATSALGRLFGKALAVLSFILAVFLYGKKQGADKAKEKAKQKDEANAAKIRARAEAARANGDRDFIEQLRENKRLRD